MAHPKVFVLEERDRRIAVYANLNIAPGASIVVIEITEMAGGKEYPVCATLPLDVAKLHFWDILNGLFTESNTYADHYGPLTICTIKKDPKYRQPYVVKLDSGIAARKPDGGLMMAACENSLTILLPEFHMRRMAMTVLDFIRDWEVCYFRHRREQMMPLQISTDARTEAN